MTPREVIARALYYHHWKGRPRTRWGKILPELENDWLEMADAVIDALENMEPTDAMVEAYLDKTGDSLSEFGWRAVVGAMRDE